MSFTPRILNQEEAAAYLGCSVNIFKERYRPHLPTYTNFFKSRGPNPLLAFDKYDLDHLIDQIKSGEIDPLVKKEQNVACDKRPKNQGGKIWVAKSRDLKTEMESGTYTKSIGEKRFDAVATRIKGIKRKQS